MENTILEQHEKDLIRWDELNQKGIMLLSIAEYQELKQIVDRINKFNKMKQ